MMMRFGMGSYRFIAGVEQTCREWQATPRPPPLAAGAKKVEGFPKLWVLTKEFSFDSKSYRLDFFFQVTGEDGMRGWSDGLHPLQLWFGVIDFLVGFSSLCMVPRCAFEVLVMFLALRFLLCL
jgi:hypothetical protein